MPELPEVETVREALEPVLTGRRLEQVQIHDVRLVSPDDPRAIAAELEGERVAAVERRGKYLVVRFESGRALLAHLRMTGSFRHASNGVFPEDDPYTRAVVKLDNGADVTYRDVRRFGTWRLLEPPEVEPYLRVRNGPEPLGPRFTAAWLAQRLAGRRAPVKAALLDQRTVAGLGNIYADEALWRARINPATPAGALAAAELRRLPRAIRDSLRHGIARQGATLRDYRRPDGEEGGMQHEFHVYGRRDEPCDRCGTPIAKTRVGGRGTWFCPACQPAPTPPAA
jgi:formamidopyrimidine-DNA glycosylase